MSYRERMFGYDNDGERMYRYEEGLKGWWFVSEPERGVDIDRRTFEYAVRIIRFFQYLCHGTDRAGWILGRQLLRSGTSIGANVAEAQSAESRADFIHKLTIAQKEARESHYWLRLFAASGIVAPQRLASLLNETQQILAILTAIIVNTKHRTLRR